MYRAVIADDESKSRKLLVKLADWDAYGISLEAQCEDGDELYEKAVQLYPDIIITDMRMPGLSGSDLIRELRSLDSSSKIIVISGFDEYEYIRQALTSKAVDYLLKPLSQTEMNLALKKAVEELDVEKARREQMTQAVMSQKLRGVLYGTGSVDKELSAYLEQRSNGLGYYGANFLFMHKDGSESLQYEELYGLIKKSLGYSALCLESVKYHNEFSAVFLGITQQEVELRAKELTTKLENAMHLRAIIGISHHCIYAADIGQACEEAKLLVLSSSADFHSKILFFDAGYSWTKKACEELSQAEYLLKSIANLGKTASLLQQITFFYQKILSWGALDIGTLRKYNGIAIEAMELLLTVCQGTESVFLQLAALENRILSTLNIKAIFQMITDFFQSLPEIFYQPVHKPKQLAYDLRDYLAVHYRDKISLSSLADHFFINKEYLSRLFRQEFSIGIFDYLDTLRIEEAKKLLMSGETINNIAASVGFYDESHFNKKFKRAVGITPKEFRP